MGRRLTTFNDVEIDLAKWTRFSMREAIIEWWPPYGRLLPNPRFDFSYATS